MKNLIKNNILSNSLTLRRDKSSPCYTGSFFIFTCISSPLYLSNSLTSRRDKSILFTATVIFIIILSVFIAYNYLHILFLVLSLENGLGLTHIAATMNSFPVRYLNTFLTLLLKRVIVAVRQGYDKGNGIGYSLKVKAKSDEKISTILSSMPSTFNYNTKRKFNTLSKVKSIKKLDPFFITGLADAESSFMIFIRKNPKIKVGWVVEARFAISFHKKDLPLLELIKYTLDEVGSIVRHSKDSYSLCVSSPKDLIHTIIPHFDKYPLIKKKRSDYELFKRVVELMNQKAHLTLKGLQQIISIKAVINKGLSDELNLSFPDVKFTTRPLFPVSKIQNSNWVSGFVEGEGNFMIMLKKNPSHKSGIQVALRFKVTQHNRDVEFIKSFVDFFLLW